MAYPSITYGVGRVPEGNFQDVISFLHAHGITRLDTARVYGNSEEALGEIGAPKEFSMTTKAPPFAPITASAEESFKNLKVDKVNIYLMHAPDKRTPSQIMEEIQPLYERGMFNKFGVSNYSAAQTRELYDYAKSKGYVLPTVYQANYNLLARKNETLLFPTLRELGIEIQAYSPAAGGFLLKSAEGLAQSENGSRWGNESDVIGKIYHGLYSRPSLIEYSKQFGELAEKSGVGRVGLTYRWIRYHSALQEQDTVVIGARNLKQLENLITEIEKGPLEAWIVERLDEMWANVEKEAPVDNMEMLERVWTPELST